MRRVADLPPPLPPVRDHFGQSDRLKLDMGGGFYFSERLSR